MSILENWLSPGLMHAVGWALLHFLWQGTALAAVAAVGMAACRRASIRYAIGLGTLTLMLLAPVATLFYLQDSGVERLAVRDVAAAVKLPATLPVAGSGPVQVSSMPHPLDFLPWLVEAWLMGVILLGVRSAGGFVLLERERRRQSTVVSPRILAVCQALQRRLAIDRAIAYCKCAWLQAPAVIGWFRPIVFLPVRALTGLSDEQLESVIAHELAHIRRFDPFVNVFQVCVETLLFYHPAVWWLNKKIRAEREHCCDEMAVALCGNAVEYARALTLMEEWRSAPALAMAANGSPLRERVVRVLGIKSLGAGTRGIGLTGGLLCLAAALIAGNVLVGMARPKQAQAAAAQPAAEPGPTPAPNAQSAATGASVKPSPARPQGSDSASRETESSYIDSLKSVGLDNLTADQLIALRIQDVTAEYVKGIQAEGLHPDVEDLIAMRVQGITPGFVRQLRAAGLNPDLHQIIALKVQGADGEYYRQLVEAGLQPNVDSLIGLKVQGVTPEYVRELRSAGLQVTADQVIALKVQDVTPEYLRALHDLGIEPRANDAIALRVQDVTPEYVRSIQALGLKPTVNELIALKVQDVTPEYIKALQAAGLKLGINEIISAKVQDVTPEFIERARQHGFKDLTVQKLIQLRQMGILDSKAEL